MQEIKLENQKDVLEEIEEIMLEEVRFYSDKTTTNSSKTQRLNITDRMVKSVNVIVAVENLKERRYMNRTERKEAVRKAKKE